MKRPLFTPLFLSCSSTFVLRCRADGQSNNTGRASERQRSFGLLPSFLPHFTTRKATKAAALARHEKKVRSRCLCTTTPMTRLTDDSSSAAAALEQAAHFGWSKSSKTQNVGSVGGLLLISPSSYLLCCTEAEMDLFSFINNQSHRLGVLHFATFVPP